MCPSLRLRSYVPADSLMSSLCDPNTPGPYCPTDSILSAFESRRNVNSLRFFNIIWNSEKLPRDFFPMRVKVNFLWLAKYCESGIGPALLLRPRRRASSVDI